MAPASSGPIALPAHQALHNLEQLIYLEQVDNLAPGTLLPVAAGLREVAQRKLNQMLDGAGSEIDDSLGGQYGRMLADPPLVMHDESPPALCSTGATIGATSPSLHGRGQRDRLRRPSADTGSARPVAALLPAIDCLAPALPAGYIGANPESGFFSPCCCRSRWSCDRPAELLGEHHLNYWWSFVCQHQRPGIDIHADQSDISLNFWITPDLANLQPGGGGLDVWDVAAPADWTFDDYNLGEKDIRAFLQQEGARQTSFAYAENRALVFRGSIFHQTAATRFADGFENRDAT